MFSSEIFPVAMICPYSGCQSLRCCMFCQSPQTISKTNSLFTGSWNQAPHKLHKKWHVSIVYLVLSLGPVACCCPKSSTHRHLQYVCKKLSHVPTHTMYRKVTYVWDQLTTIPHWPISLLCCVDMLTICMCAPTSAAKPYYLPERHMGGFCHCEKFSVLKLSISYNVFHFAVWHFCLGVHITLGRTTVCKPLCQCVPTQCFDIHTDRQTYIQTVHTIPAQPTSTQPT